MIILQNSYKGQYLAVSLDRPWLYSSHCVLMDMLYKKCNVQVSLKQQDPNNPLITFMQLNNLAQYLSMHSSLYILGLSHIHNYMEQINNLPTTEFRHLLQH